MFMSTKEAAAKWGISERRVRVLCAQGRVDGAIQSSWAYLIPTTSAKPRDGRQLRHQKQEHLRLGGSGLEALQTVRATDLDTLFTACIEHIDPFLIASFAVEGRALTQEDLTQLTTEHIVPSLSLVDHLLALHMRSMILSMARASSLGQRVGASSTDELCASLTLGLGETGSPRREGLGDDLEVFLMQDEGEFSASPPLVRALFCYGELLRIAPYPAYNGLVAALVYARIMLEGGWAPTLVERERIDELKATLVMTKRRGNYLALTDLVSESYEGSARESSSRMRRSSMAWARVPSSATFWWRGAPSAPSDGSGISRATGSSTAGV